MEVKAVVDAQGSVRLLLDMEQFRWEKINAWGADLKFGKTYRKQIDKLAIVGDKKYEKLIAKIAEPYYAREARLFNLANIEDAWTWVKADPDAGE